MKRCLLFVLVVLCACGGDGPELVPDAMIDPLSPDTGADDCGNGRVDVGEECDDGADNTDTVPDSCRTDCSLPACGDGITDEGEACDDGNREEGDVCSADCSSNLACGNGIVDDGEECDEGEDNSDGVSDACRSDCRRSRCGDGTVDTGEACDDGNAVDDDACRNSCALGTCGDGTLDDGEECDDGNRVDGDGCQVNCSVSECSDDDDCVAPDAMCGEATYTTFHATCDSGTSCAVSSEITVCEARASTCSGGEITTYRATCDLVTGCGETSETSACDRPATRCVNDGLDIVTYEATCADGSRCGEARETRRSCGGYGVRCNGNVFEYTMGACDAANERCDTEIVRSVDCDEQNRQECSATGGASLAVTSCRCDLALGCECETTEQACPTRAPYCSGRAIRFPAPYCNTDRSECDFSETELSCRLGCCTDALGNASCCSIIIVPPI